MLTLGLLSMLQIGWLPGFLALRLAGVRVGIVLTGILSILLSLFINHIVIVLLVFTGLLSRTVVLWGFALEVLVLVGTCRLARYRNISPSWHIDRDIIGRFVGGIKAPGGRPLLATVGLCVAALSILHMGYFALQNVGSVFTQWDSVVSWNRWAVSWAEGAVPGQMWQYPQLMPSNWAITYLFIGSTQVQVFAKALMPVFPFLALLSIALDRAGDTTGVVAVWYRSLLPAVLRSAG